MGILFKDVSYATRVLRMIVEAINGINLKIKDGEFVAIIGKTGGKSTLVQHMNATQPSKGTETYGNIPPKEKTKSVLFVNM